VSSDSDPLDRYAPEMNGFFRDAKRQYAQIDERFQAVEKLYDESVSWFGESPAQLGWEEYFETWDSFATSYLLAERRVEDEEKLKEKEQKRKEWLESQQKAKAEKGGGGGLGKVKKKGVKKKKKKQLYDNVMGVIKGGGNDSDAIFNKLQKMRKEKKKKDTSGDPNLKH